MGKKRANNEMFKFILFLFRFGGFFLIESKHFERQTEPN